MADRAQLLSLAGIGNLITDQGVRSCSMSAFKSGSAGLAPGCASALLTIFPCAALASAGGILRRRLDSS